MLARDLGIQSYELYLLEQIEKKKNWERWGPPSCNVGAATEIISLLRNVFISALVSWACNCEFHFILYIRWNRGTYSCTSSLESGSHIFPRHAECSQSIQAYQQLLQKEIINKKQESRRFRPFYFYMRIMQSGLLLLSSTKQKTEIF